MKIPTSKEVLACGEAFAKGFNDGARSDGIDDLQKAIRNQLVAAFEPSFHFTVPGPPVPKARARHGRGRRSYTPTKTASYEEKVALCARLALNKTKGWPTSPNARFFVECDVFRQHKRGDFDNFLKSILDGLNGVAWTDDSQVVGGTVRRFDGFIPPRCEVVVREIDMGAWKP